MAHKIKDVEGYFNRLRKLYEEIIEDNPGSGLLDELDGDRRILAHAVFYIVSRTMTKKMDGMGPFELLRVIEERMLRQFIVDPNSERVDQLLEKADLLYELLPYCISQCIADGCAADEDYTFSEGTLFETQGLLVAAGGYALGVEDDMLDSVFDSLSLRTGKVGSPIIEADAAEIMENAKCLAYEIDDATDCDDEDEAPTIVELRGLDVDRQMLVVGLLSINMDGMVEGIDCPETGFLREDVEKAVSAFDSGEELEEIEDCIDDVIESIKGVVGYIMDEDRKNDNATNLFCTMFTGMLAVYIRDAHDLSDKDFAKVWSKVRPDGRFDDDALIAYSRKIVERDLPKLIKEFVSDQK